MFILLIQLILIGIMLRISCRLHDDRMKLIRASQLAEHIISTANFYLAKAEGLKKRGERVDVAIEGDV